MVRYIPAMYVAGIISLVTANFLKYGIESALVVLGVALVFSPVAVAIGAMFMKDFRRSR